jgi:hypothetical protein
MQVRANGEVWLCETNKESNRVGKYVIWFYSTSVSMVTGTYCITTGKGKGKGKGKLHARTGYEGPKGEQRYSPTLSLTSALDVGGQRHAPANLPPRKNRYPLCRSLSGPDGHSGCVWKISPTPGFDPQTVQPLASRYTD